MVLSGWITTMITSCVIWIPVTALVFYLLRVWVRYRARSLLPQLRQPDSNGRTPRVVGFFHPYCNAGGGGERVLWTAIRALQNRYPRLKCVIYTGDLKVTGDEILAKAREQFNIVLPRTSSEDLAFVFLQRRKWVEDKPYPLFTLLGQSVGSVVLGWEALMHCVPDVFVDTMGYAFTLPLFKYLGGCRVACYVHYPTISTDMLDRVSSRTSAHNNASFISRSPLLSYVKLLYYRIFAYVYGMAGKRSDVIMVNSTWTQGHIISLWKAPLKTFVLYPPCDTNNFLSVPLMDDSERKMHYIVSIAQFRPEKDHPLQLRSFHKFLSGLTASQSQNYKLLLIGSVRNAEDASRVENLRTLCKEIDLTDRVEFKLNVSFEELKNDLAGATVGLHTMWNEHFGIGVVECMAAGSIILAHDSGGPKLDIVVNYENQKTGFLADDINSYAAAMETIFAMTSEERLIIRTNARKSVTRFSEKNFEDGFIDCSQSLFQEF